MLELTVVTGLQQQRADVQPDDLALALGCDGNNQYAGHSPVS